jgi:hypothetical protein
MPKLPRIGPPQGNIPVYESRVNPYGIAARELEDLTQQIDVYQRIALAADNAESSMLQQTGARRLEGAVQQAKDNYGDPTVFESFATGQSEEIVKNTLDGARNERVKTQAQQKLADDIVKAQTAIKHHVAELGISAAKGNLDVAMDEAVKRRIATEDPAEQSRIDSQMSQNLNDLIRAGVYKPGEGIKKVTEYRSKILNGSADVQIRSNPEGFLADMQEGKWDQIDLDTRLKLGERARKAIEDQERKQDKVTKEVKDIVMNNLQAAANRGAISPADMQELLSGRNPYVKASEARTLNEVNSNPPTGGGNDSVKAIASEYYLSPRTLPHINATRAKLRALQAQLGRPDPLISKLANELQSDTTTLENQGIARESNEIQRQNRAINDLKTTYEAWVDTNPFMKKLLGNMAERDKARIADTYKKQGPDAAKALLDSLIKNGAVKKDAVQQKHGSALDW